MKKLFKVDVTTTVLVAAENENEAIEGAEYALLMQEGVEFDYDVPVQITTKDEIPKDWQGAIAFGGDDDKTCEEILEEGDT